MKKIITAINNPKLNEELKKEKNFEIIGKDIQYREAILETLENNKYMDIIIISEQIPGEIELESLIEKIKLVNEEIKIVFILEKENSELEKILIKNNILDIYYNDKINLKELIKIINKKEINMEEEIIKLKKIIEEKNIYYKKEEKKKETKKFTKENFKRIKSEIKSKVKSITKKSIKKSSKRNMSTKIITFSGNSKSGKSTLSLIISQCLSDKNYKVLLIDGDLDKQDLTTIIVKDKTEKVEKSKNRYKKQKKEFKNNFFYKINTNDKNKFRKENNFLKNKKIKRDKKNIKLNNTYKKLINRKNKIYFYDLINIINLFTTKINRNLYFFNGLNFLLKNKIVKKENILQKMIFSFFQIIKQNYDFIIIDLSKSNFPICNKVIFKDSYTNFVLMEPNLLGIKEVISLLDLYLNKWKLPKYSLHIVSNRKNVVSVNRRLISKSIPLKNKIFEIKENKFYYIFTNHYFNRKLLLKNKTIKYELNKIINKIIFKY